MMSCAYIWGALSVQRMRLRCAPARAAFEPSLDWAPCERGSQTRWPQALGKQSPPTNTAAQREGIASTRRRRNDARLSRCQFRSALRQQPIQTAKARAGFIKAGLAGDPLPTVHIPCLVGRPVVSGGSDAGDLRSVVVGQECVTRQRQLQLSHPIANGIIQNFDDMGCVWRHVFNDLLEVCARRLCSF